MLALEVQVDHSRGLYFSCSFDLQGLYDTWNICYGYILYYQAMAESEEER